MAAEAKTFAAVKADTVGAEAVSGAELNQISVDTAHADECAPGGTQAAEKATEESSGDQKDSGSKTNALWPFIIISITYLLFTTTDGAVRMLVLLHAYNKGFSAMQVAIMFTMYELLGAVTNLVAGVAGAKWGIRATLVSGLVLQIGGLGMLYAWDDGWDKVTAIIYVTAAQALCGIAKDLTKLGGKTVTKLVTPEEKQETLFKLVSFITGYKNSFKGIGYFMGAALLEVSYDVALHVNIGFIAVALPFAMFGLSSQLGQVRSKNINLETVFNQNDNVNYLSLARMFLFGSRDLWFEVPLPFYLRSPTGLNWPRSAVGATLAGYIILYGQFQTYTPQLVLKPLQQSPPNKWVCILWNSLLALSPIYMLVMTLLPEYDTNAHDDPSTTKAVTLMIGIFSFAFVFGVNSAIHSYLVVKYAEGSKVATTVGFYYMANALGRLVGTILSGALYSYVGDDQNDGLATCFAASVVFVVITTVVTHWVDDASGGLRCGGSLHCLGAGPLPETPTVSDTQPEQAPAGGSKDKVESVNYVDKVDDCQAKQKEQL